LILCFRHEQEKHQKIWIAEYMHTCKSSSVLSVPFGTGSLAQPMA